MSHTYGGGQNRKVAKHPGRVSGETPTSVCQHLEKVAPKSFFPLEDPQPKCYDLAVMQDLCCPVCTMLLDRPIELGCGTILCLKCIKSWVQFQCSHSLTCPCCYGKRLESSHIRHPPTLVVSLLKGLLVHCSKECGKIVRVDNYKLHLKGLCTSHYHHRVDSPSKLTIGEVLSRSTTSPVTPAEAKVAGHLVRKLMDQGSSSNADGVVKVQTRGQVSNCIQTKYIIHYNQNQNSQSPSFKWLTAGSPALKPANGL